MNATSEMAPENTLVATVTTVNSSLHEEHTSVKLKVTLPPLSLDICKDIEYVSVSTLYLESIQNMDVLNRRSEIYVIT